MINNKVEIGIIYGWYNMKSGKWYVGQTIHPERRFNQHINNAVNKRDNTHFHRALLKYPLDTWVYCILEDNILRENLNMREMDWIEYYDSFYDGYNMTSGGETNSIISDEIKKKIGESHKRCNLSKETLNKMSIAQRGPNNPMYGKPSPRKGIHFKLTEETKRKISESNKGHIVKTETKRKISQANKGRISSEETKRKLSESHKGQTPWNKGKTGIYSEETRKKISNTLKGRHISEEVKTKISEKLKGHIGYFKGKPAPNRKKVSQYDLNGNYIQTFNSLKEAQEKTNIAKSSICTVCKGNSKQAGGFIWKYAS